MPNTSTVDFVAGDTVNVVLAGWNTFTSYGRCIESYDDLKVMFVGARR